MTASDTSPRQGHECDGASDLEQRVLRERLEAQSEFLSDELRLRSEDSLQDHLQQVRRTRVELAVTEKLLEQYVNGSDGEEIDDVDEE
jgi:hypothetical protein